MTFPPYDIASFPVTASADQLEGLRQEAELSLVQERSTTFEELERIEVRARELCDDRSVKSTERLIHLRAFCKQEIESPVRDVELRQIINQVRRERLGVAEPIGPEEKLFAEEAPWIWEGVVLKGTTTLVLALPKVGKSRLMTQMIGRLHHGAPDFLGQKLADVCPKVLIVGTDQPKNDWVKCLRLAGLLDEQGNQADCMVGLYTAGCPLHIDEEGIEKIVEYCEEYPGLLILLDSYAKCVQGLGLDERSADIADPLSDLQEAIAPYEATLVVIHHANKQSQGQSASMASRGSTALPAAVSQIVSMARVSSEEQSPIARRDNRIKLMTEGREGEPLELLIEQVEGGNSWHLHGTAEQIRQTQGFSEVIEKLTDRQDEALSDICNHWIATGRGMDARHLENALKLKRQAARKVIQALKSKGLIIQWGQSETSSVGRPRILFRPVSEILDHYSS